MWSLSTLNQINDKAVELARAGKPERDALKECGIYVPQPILVAALPPRNRLISEKTARRLALVG